MLARCSLPQIPIRTVSARVLLVALLVLWGTSALAAPVTYNRVVQSSSVAVSPGSHIEEERVLEGQVVLDTSAQQIEIGASVENQVIRALQLADASADGTSLAAEVDSQSDGCDGASPCPVALSITGGYVTLADTAELFRPKALLSAAEELLVNIAARGGRAQGEASDVQFETYLAQPTALALADLSGSYRLINYTNALERFVDGTSEEEGSVSKIGVTFNGDGTCSGSIASTNELRQETPWPSTDLRQSIFATIESGSDFAGCNYTVDTATGSAAVVLEISDGGDTLMFDLPLFVSSQARYLSGRLNSSEDTGTSFATEFGTVLGVRTGTLARTNADIAGVYFLTTTGETFSGTDSAGLDSDFVTRSALQFLGGTPDSDGFSDCNVLGAAFAGAVRALGGSVPNPSASEAVFAGEASAAPDECRYRVESAEAVTLELISQGFAQQTLLALSDDAQTLLGTRAFSTDDPLPADVDVSLPVPSIATIELLVLQRYSGAAGDAAVVDFVAPIVPALDAAVTVVASVLPGSRSVQVGETATAFATMINGGSADAVGCDIRYGGSRNLTFSYQQTAAATNAPLGEPDRAVDIAAGAAQSWVFSITPNELFSSEDIALNFSCLNGSGATTVVGLNTLLLSSSAAPVADLIALGLTPSRNGIAELSGAALTGFFTLASFNVGVQDQITVRVDTGAATLPVATTLCETDPLTAVCINPTVPTSAPVVVDVPNGGSPTFAVFLDASESIALDPANKRVFVRFTDSAGVVRGATSVAVQTQ